MRGPFDLLLSPRSYLQRRSAAWKGLVAVFVGAVVGTGLLSWTLTVFWPRLAGGSTAAILAVAAVTATLVGAVQFSFYAQKWYGRWMPTFEHYFEYSGGVRETVAARVHLASVLGVAVVLIQAVAGLSVRWALALSFVTAVYLTYLMAVGLEVFQDIMLLDPLRNPRDLLPRFAYRIVPLYIDAPWDAVQILVMVLFAYLAGFVLVVTQELRLLRPLIVLLGLVIFMAMD